MAGNTLIVFVICSLEILYTLKKSGPNNPADTLSSFSDVADAFALEPVAP